MNKPWVRITVWVIVGALVLAGAATAITALLSSSSSSTTSSTPTPSEASPEAGSSVAPTAALQKFYGQRLTWSSCRDSFSCAKLTVPLDYANPTGQTIQLALLKVPASGHRIGSLVVNPGGPGAPGTDYAASAKESFGAAVRNAFDIVGFDPRGTGESAPIDCLSDADLSTYINLDPDPDTAAEESESFAFGVTFGKGCVAKSGALASHVSTVEAARDMDVLRSALGENELTYFGASYGTKLGATYADLFPTKVGRFVLDGAIDPALSTAEMNLEQARGFQTALDSYIDNCLTGSKSCYLGSSRSEAQAKISAFLDQLDAKPLTTSDGTQLTEGEAFLGIALPLYSRDYWSILTSALKDAFDGKADTLLALANAYVSRDGTTFTDNSMEAIYAINCLDDPWALTTAAEVDAVTPKFLEASPTFGRIFAWMDTACAGSQVKSTSAPHALHAKGSAPIVVVGTTRDPATPVQWAKSLAAQLDNGVLVTRDGDGHTGYNAGNSCVDNAIEKYLVNDVVPSNGLAC
ncbi:alpha/beta hydrolase [Nocardioides sp.]|uniref:alpha/beta hydrolase n=1 Tax=Nocardioides sp. TaxID=35761 RepID=UPI00260E42AC|nr:alpha/beta hydrolase [Nocardioides sp.]